MHKTTFSVANAFLYIGMLLMIIKVSFSLSSIVPYNDYIDSSLSFASAACLAIHILQKKYSIKRLIIYLAVAVLAVYSSVKIGHYPLLITVITCLAISDESIEKVGRYIFNCERLFLCLHTIYAIMRYLFINESLYVVMSGTNRYHFGMQHPNRFSIYLFNLIVLWLFLNFKRLKNIHLVVIFIINIVLYELTKTRTNYINTIILIVLFFLIINTDNKFRKLIKIIAQYITPVLAVITMLFIRLYLNGNELALRMDDVFSARIRLGAYMYHKYGLTWLGENVSYSVEWDTTWKLSNLTFDNAYSYLCISQGIIWLLILCVLFFRLAKKYDTRVHFAIIVWALYGVTEIHGLNGYLSFPIFLTALLLNNENNIETDEAERVKSIDQ